MPVYRLSYPASIFASVEAASPTEAKKKFVEALDNIMYEGIDLGFCTEHGDRLYADTDEQGELTIAKVEIEDIEE